MSTRSVEWAIPKPPVSRACKVCEGSIETRWAATFKVGHGVVSPTGIEHTGLDGGLTACGKDATGDGWWWPL